MSMTLGIQMSNISLTGALDKRGNIEEKMTEIFQNH